MSYKKLHKKEEKKKKDLKKKTITQIIQLERKLNVRGVNKSVVDYRNMVYVAEGN